MKFKFFKSFKFFPGPERKALAVFAAISMIVFAIVSLNAFFDVFYYYEITNTLEYQKILANSIVPQNMPVFAEFSLLHPAMLTFIIFFLSADASAVSYGVWRGRSWGRISAAYSLYIMAAVLLILVIFPQIVIPQPVNYQNGDFEQYNSFAKILSLVFRIMSTLLIFLSLWGARYFEKLSVFPSDNFYLPEKKDS